MTVIIEDVVADGEDAGGFVVVEVLAGVEAERECGLGEGEGHEAAVETDGQHDGEDAELADGFADDGVDAGIEGFEG